MDTVRWDRAGSIFERLLGAAEAERPTLLDSLCGDDAELRKIVLSMLDSENSALRFEERILRRAGIAPGGDTTSEMITEAGEMPIGPWHLVRRIGSGGMGVVWLAERADGQFEQRAALKLIKRGMDSEAVLKRFLRERQILARLDHPHIAHLLDGGITGDGRPYFAMEYVEGLPLLRYCSEHGSTLEQRLDLFIEVCAAVQFAHENHVVHRDLKPSNILVTTAGTVKLLDFGIAKLLDTDDSNSETITHLQRERPMTPAYAAPEQIRGEAISEATDIYALGCVLYELLTGQRSYDFSGAHEPKDVLQIIESSSPVPPSRRRAPSAPVPPRRLRGDLDTIVLTALRREPARRYPSVAALAADLSNFFKGKAISARRDNLLYRTYKYLRRNRAGAAAALLVTAIALAAIVFETRERTPPLAIRGSAIAIVDFNNLSRQEDNEWIRSALEEELATELTIGGELHTLPGEIVRPAHADLPPPQMGGYARTSLETLRKRLGADFVLSGSYLVSAQQGAASVRLDLAMQDIRSGAAVASFSESGALVDLPKLVEKAGARLRSDLGFAPERDVLSQVASAQPATLDLSRRMGLALDALHRSDPARARDELLEAIIMAPSYAPAYVYLAEAFKQLGYDAKALAYAQQAATHAGSLPPIQRLQISRQVAVQKSEWQEALNADRQLLDLDHKNIELHLSYVSDLLDAGNPDGAEAALKTLAELPGAGDPRVELKAAGLSQVRGDVKAQLRHAELALQRARDRDEPGLAAHAKRALGIAVSRSGDRKRAAVLFAEAVDEFQRGGNPKGEAGARTSLANLLVAENESEQAREEYQRALAIYQRIGDQDGLASIYSNMEMLLEDRGDRDAAETAARHVLEIRRETGDLAGQAWALLALGGLKVDDAADDATMEMYRQALALDERAGQRVHHLTALGEYAEALRLRGDLKSAEETCRQAQADAKALANARSAARVELQCAKIRRDMGEIAEASAMLQRAMSVARDAHSTDIEVRAETELAVIALGNGHFADAVGGLERAATYFADGEQITEEAIARASLALCYEALKRRDERDRATTRARELRSAITTRVAAATVDRLLAQLRAHTGERTAVVSVLENLAVDAEGRQWLALSLEARLIALELLQATNSSSVPDKRRELEQMGRQHGFGWVLARLAKSES